MLENRLKTLTLFLGGLLAISIAFISLRKVKKIKTLKAEQNKDLTDLTDCRSEHNTSAQLDRQNEEVDNNGCDDGEEVLSPTADHESLTKVKSENESRDNTLIQFEGDLGAEKDTKDSIVIHQRPLMTVNLLENNETSIENRSSIPEEKTKAHSQKSKIPHFGSCGKTKFGLSKNKTTVHPERHESDASRESPSKHLRFGKYSTTKKPHTDEFLKLKYKSLFRSDQQKDQICDSDRFPDINEDNGFSLAENDSLITDEDGSNLLVESGFFDNDLNVTPESPDLPEVDLFEPRSPSGSSERVHVASEDIKSDSTFDQRFNEQKSEQLSDDALFREAEEELLMNIAIQKADIKALLEITSKSESVRLLIMAFQTLAEFSRDTSNHKLYLNHLDFIYSLLDMADDTLKVEVLKVLLNLSRNTETVPSLLSAKAPASLLKYFLLDICEDVQLNWLAFVLNLFESGKRNKSPYQTADSLKKGGIDSISGILFGIRSSRIIKNRVYLLTRHRNRHVGSVARQIYSDMSRRDGV